MEKTINVWTKGEYFDLTCITVWYSDKNVLLNHNVIIKGKVYIIDNILLDENLDIKEVIVSRSYTFDENDE